MFYSIILQRKAPTANKAAPAQGTAALARTAAPVKIANVLDVALALMVWVESPLANDVPYNVDVLSGAAVEP
jgi:hypothetical protein